MKIGIDATSLYNQKTGIGFYTHNLINSMSEVDNNELILFSKRSLLKPVEKRIEQIKFENKNNIHYKFTRMHPKIMFSLWDIIKFPTIEMYTGKLDIVHGTNYLPLPSNKAKKVVTIHDLSFLIYPQYVAAKTRTMFQNYVPKIVNKVDLIITDSYSSKKDIVNMLNVNENKVKVTHLAAGKEFKVLEDRSGEKILKERFTNGYPYILFVGTLEPRKNIVNLIKAFNIIKNRLGNEFKLVLCGRKGWYFDEIFDTIKELELNNEVIVTDYVTNDELVKLYNFAELFVYPSLYEGFGLPPLEAMSCGTPVIVSNTSSLPEVVGEAAKLVNPLDIEQLAFEMENVLCDEQLKKKMKVESLENAMKFSWHKTAIQTLNAYRELL